MDDNIFLALNYVIYSPASKPDPISITYTEDNTELNLFSTIIYIYIYIYLLVIQLQLIKYLLLNWMLRALNLSDFLEDFSSTVKDHWD